MDRKEELSRRFVLRAYGMVSVLSLFLGLFLFIAGIMALKLSDPPQIHKPPYYIMAFAEGMCIICSGICTLYIYLTQAPLIDYYFLEDAAVKRIRQSVTGNTVSSVLCFIFSVVGLFVCVAFGLVPCGTDVWPFECSYSSNIGMNQLLCLIIAIILAICLLLTFYSSLMSCIHGWVFDFDVITIKTRNRNENNSNSERPVSGFQQVAMFDIEDQFSEDDDLQPSSKYNATSSFKQAGERHSDEYEHLTQHDYSKMASIPTEQAPNYVAVLNDPAMKQKLKERKNCLQEQ